MKVPTDGETGQARELPKSITVRAGTADDETGAFDVMRRSLGFEMVWDHHAPFRRHMRSSNGCRFYVAEEHHRVGAPKIVGYARCMVRESVWMLTDFFVLPDFQTRGIGSALLDRCREWTVGAETRLILASQHPDADSLYVRKLGCFPRVPMLLICGKLSRIADFGIATDEADLIAGPIEDEPETLAQIDLLDRETVGYARPEEHRYWIREMGGAEGPSRLFRDAGGSLLGYAYMGIHSSGPACAADEELTPRFVSTVAAIASSRGPGGAVSGFTSTGDHYLALPGVNEQMLRFLLERKWRIAFHYLFMSTAPLGRLQRYVCYNPLYVL